MARTPISAIARFAPCTINVKGKVMYSRVATRVEGEELAQKNQQAASQGRIPHTKPYISITIQDPVIINASTIPAEVVSAIQERFYATKEGVAVFTQESKSPFMPIVAYGPEAGQGLAGQGIADDKIHLPAELAKGLDVTIGVNLYSKNNFSGLGIGYILVNEPIKYYTNASVSNDFEAMGISYTAPTAQDTPVIESIAQQPAYTAPVQQTYSAPTQAAYAPVQQPTYTTPVQPAAPQIEPAPWVTDNPFPAPQPQVAPQQGQPAQVQKPVRYY